MIHLQHRISYKGKDEMGEFDEFGGILQYAHPPLLLLHELVLLGFLKRHEVEVALNQLLKPFSVEPMLILSLSHSRPPEIDFALKIEHLKSYLPLLRVSESIEQLLQILNPILVGNTIVDRWVVTSESLKHMGVVLLNLLLLGLHQFLQVLVLSLQLFLSLIHI